MKIVLLVFALGISLFLSCRNEDDALLCDEKATLRDFITGFDGLLNLLLVLYNDNEWQVLEIGELEFEPAFEFSDGLRVRVTYEEFSGASICIEIHGPMVNMTFEV